MNKMLISGVSGFIGGYLSSYFLNKYEVHGLTRMSTGGNKVHSKLQLHNVDICDSKSLEKIIVKINPSIFIHTAAYGVGRGQTDPNIIFNTNIIGTKNILNILQKNIAPTKVILTGSCYEYGNSRGKLLEDSTLIARSMYDISKITGTFFAKYFTTNTNLPISVLRLFTPYGPYEKKERFIPRTILNALNNEPIYVSKKSIRDFIYVDDVARAYECVINQKSYDSKNIVFNIGSGKKHSVYAIAKYIVSRLHSSSPIILTDEFFPKDDSQCWANIQNAKKHLLWEPATSIKDGIDKTIEFIKSNPKMYI